MAQLIEDRKDAWRKLELRIGSLTTTIAQKKVQLDKLRQSQKAKEMEDDIEVKEKKELLQRLTNKLEYLDVKLQTQVKRKNRQTRKSLNGKI